MASNVVYNYTVTGYTEIYDKRVANGAPRAYIYFITRSSNLNVTKNSTHTNFTDDMNKLNIYGLSNDYEKTYVNTNYYTHTQFDN